MTTTIKVNSLITGSQEMMDACALMGVTLEIEVIAVRPTLEDFIRATKGRCRRRVFGPMTYQMFCAAVEEAERKAAFREPFLWQDDAGRVARNYGYGATTAVAAVWTTPDGEIVQKYCRTSLSPYGVRRPYPGGRTGYERDWKQELLKKGKVFR